MGNGEGIGIIGWIMILLVLALIVIVLLFYFKVLDFQSFKNDIIQDTPTVQVVTPPVENEWCKIQNLSNTKILGWDATNQCCVQEWELSDICLNKIIKVHRCYIGDIGTVIKWSKIDGYYLDDPAKYINFLNIDAQSSCSLIVYPGINQDINIKNNMVVI